MEKLLIGLILLQICFYVGFALENAATSYEMDLIESSKLGGSLFENFEKEAQLLERDFASMPSTKITHKENCDGSYNEILNKIALLATKLNTSVAVELKENWTSNTHVVLNRDGSVIFVTKNDSTLATNEQTAGLGNPINYTKEFSFKVNEKLTVKFGILENINSQKFGKSAIHYLLSGVLLELLSNIWFVLKLVLVICTVYVLEML